MYDPGDPTGGSPPPPPPPTGAPPITATPRYVYLVGRLRGRQITMEEATELFSLQQQMVRDALSRIPPPAAGPAGGATPAPGGSRLSTLPPMSDEGLAWSLLAIGSAAGILAAILKRAQGGPAPVPRRSP